MSPKAFGYGIVLLKGFETAHCLRTVSVDNTLPAKNKNIKSKPYAVSVSEIMPEMCCTMPIFCCCSELFVVSVVNGGKDTAQHFQKEKPLPMNCSNGSGGRGRRSGLGKYQLFKGPTPFHPVSDVNVEGAHRLYQKSLI